MEFDKTRVYTAVNADELPIGSRCLFATELGKKVARIKYVQLVRKWRNDKCL